MIKSKSILRVTLSLGLVSYLVACNSIKLLSTSPINNVYCDNFLIYEMCAEDTDNDGIVEHVYFADTSEVFLYRQGAKESIPDLLRIAALEPWTRNWLPRQIVFLESPMKLLFLRNRISEEQ